MWDSAFEVVPVKIKLGNAAPFAKLHKTYLQRYKPTTNYMNHHGILFLSRDICFSLHFIIGQMQNA